MFPNTHTHAGGGKYGNTGPNGALSHTESKPGICHHKLAKCCLTCQIIRGKSHGYLEDVNHVPAGLFAGYSLSLLNIYSCHAYIEITSYFKLLGLMKQVEQIVH